MTHQNMQDPAYRQKLLTQARTARLNILVMMVFTVLNLVLYIARTDSFFLFSAYVPYLVLVFCDAHGVLAIGIVLGLLLTLLYLPPFLLSGKKAYWFYVVGAAFALDTLVMLYVEIVLGETFPLLNLVFHLWVMYYCVAGVRAARTLSRMPAFLPDPASPPADQYPPQ
ncbi:MAG: hypothetical protein WDA00_02730 [Eubacteriales bacterium]